MWLVMMRVLGVVGQGNSARVVVGILKPKHGLEIDDDASLSQNRDVFLEPRFLLAGAVLRQPPGPFLLGILIPLMYPLWLAYEDVWLARWTWEM